MKSMIGKICLLALLIIASITTSQAHELPSNRLSLVLRDDTHIALTYLLDYTKVLHQTMEPQRPIAEFAIAYSTMPPADFQKALRKAELKMSSATKISLQNGEQLMLTNWRWPEAGKVQALLQQRVMHAVVAANTHQHEPAVEVQADATSNQKIASVFVALPESMGSVLVVSSKPKQKLVAANSPKAQIKFF
jgi:hypothetical protein